MPIGARGLATSATIIACKTKKAIGCASEAKTYCRKENIVSIGAIRPNAHGHQRSLVGSVQTDWTVGPVPMVIVIILQAIAVSGFLVKSQEIIAKATLTEQTESVLVHSFMP